MPIRIVLLALCAFLATELSFRVYLYGSSALNPWRMNSFTEIHDSGLVKAAEAPEVVYELKPNLDGYYKGMPFQTNSVGMRDQEYSVTKPDNTFRIAVLGSSWEMGSGVNVEDIWHTQLENMLIMRDDGKHYEVLNFGVDQYGLGEFVGTLEKKVAAYSPDLVLVGITFFTPVMLWSDPPEVYKEYARRNPFFEFHSLYVIDDRLGLGVYTPDDPMRQRAERGAGMLAQKQKAAARFIDYSKIHDTPVVVIKLAYQAGWSIDKLGVGEYRDPGLIFFDITNQIRSHGYKPEVLQVSVWDTHPNRFTHSLIANAVYANLLELNLLPDRTERR